jgi:hypothetical protein
MNLKKERKQKGHTKLQNCKEGGFFLKLKQRAYEAIKIQKKKYKRKKEMTITRTTTNYRQY